MPACSPKLPIDMIRLIVILLAVAAGVSHASEGLRVDGNRMLFGSREIRLQGIAMGDPLLARSDRPLDDIDHIAHDWNANVVRISVHPGVWREFGRRKVLDTLHEHVAQARNAGMFAIITWHAIGVPDGYRQAAPDGLMHDLYDTRFELAEDFWLKIALEFGHDKNVMFELWNEPTWPTQPDGSHRLPKWPLLKPYWTRLIALIRPHSDNVVIVTGNGWGYNLKGIRHALIEDDNVAYAWHVYAGTDGNNPERWAAHLDGLDALRPVIVTEWGFRPDTADSAYPEDSRAFGEPFVREFLEGRNLHHTAWCYHPIWGPRLIEPDWRTPTSFGVFVKSLLWRTPPHTVTRP